MLLGRARAGPCRDCFRKTRGLERLEWCCRLVSLSKTVAGPWRDYKSRCRSVSRVVSWNLRSMLVGYQPDS